MTERWRHAHCRHPWALLVCNTHKNVRSMHRVCVQQKNARATGECVHLLRRTHSSCCYVGANPRGTTPTTKRKNITPLPSCRTSFIFFWISLTRTLSTSLLSTNHQMCELMLLGFPRHALVLILDDAFVEFWIWVPVHREVVFPIVWERLYNPPSYSLRVYTAPSYSLEFQVGICNELLEFGLPATRNCLLHEFSSRPFHSDTFTTHSFSKDWYIMRA